VVDVGVIEVRRLGGWSVAQGSDTVLEPKVEFLLAVEDGAPAGSISKRKAPDAASEQVVDANLWQGFC